MSNFNRIKKLVDQGCMPQKMGERITLDQFLWIVENTVFIIPRIGIERWKLEIYNWRRALTPEDYDAVVKI